MSDMQNINDLLKQYKKQGSSTQPAATDGSAQAKFDEKMREIEIKEKEAMAQSQAAQKGVHYINLFGFPIAPEILRLVDKTVAEKVQAVAFFKNDASIRLGAVDLAAEGLDDLKEFLASEHSTSVEVYLISEHSFQSAYKLYATLPVFRKAETGVTITEDDLERFKSQITDFASLNQKIKEVNITDVITLIIAASIKSDSSDVHVEAEEHQIKIRFRVDGVLLDVAEVDAQIWPKVVSRIKLLAGLKINITDKPQDGRFTISLTEDKIDVRVSCLPTTYGESVVMRLLRSKSIALSFDDLGLRAAEYARLKEQIERPQGMIITTGPTGSGKTTSLYAILRHLNDEETKIITLEDPVEYKLAGVNQSQIDRTKGYTFADGLRSILRQDPDVIMVGELRDLETADVAINAALTGHLVVSTLHTNSAAGAIPRFLAMEVKPFLLAPALNAIIGQRLVRRVCKDCKEVYQPSEDQLQKIREILGGLSEASGEQVDFDNMTFYKGGGCETCNGLGYKGRVGIYEILIMNKEIESLILNEQVSEYDMQEIAKKQGMVTMVQDGLLKAINGLTTVEEIFRVIE